MDNLILIVYICTEKSIRVQTSTQLEKDYPYSTIRIYYECEGGIENSFPKITDWHHEACEVMTIGYREGRLFQAHPHTNYGFFFLLTTKSKNMKKDLQKILNKLRCAMVTSFYHCNDGHETTCDHRAAVRFLSFPRAGTGMCDRIISHG